MYTDCDSKCHIQAYANCDAYSYSYTYEYAQRYANCNSYCYEHGQCYVNSYPYSYGQANADCPASRNTETTPDSAAAPRVRNHGISREFSNWPRSPPWLQLVEIFNHLLNAADHQREAIVIEFVWHVAR